MLLRFLLNDRLQELVVVEQLLDLALAQDDR